MAAKPNDIDPAKVAQAKAAIMAAKSGQGKKSKRHINTVYTRTDEDVKDTGKDKQQEFDTSEKIKVGKNLLGQTKVKIKSYQTPNDSDTYNSGSHRWESSPSNEYWASHGKHDKKEKYKITFKGDPEDNNYKEKIKQKKEVYEERPKGPAPRVKAGYGAKEKTFTTTKEGEKKGFSTEKHKSKGYNHLLGTLLPKTPRRFR